MTWCRCCACLSPRLPGISPISGAPVSSAFARTAPGRYYSLAEPRNSFHAKLLDCLGSCFADVPELGRDRTPSSQDQRRQVLRLSLPDFWAHDIRISGYHGNEKRAQSTWHPEGAATFIQSAPW